MVLMENVNSPNWNRADELYGGEECRVNLRRKTGA